jgi:hypothetical protein
MYISGTPTIVVGGIEVHTGLLVSGTLQELRKYQDTNSIAAWKGEVHLELA